MTIKVTSECKGYSPDMVRKRYLRYAGAYQWHWCEVGENRSFDLRQGVSNDMRDFPFDVADAAINQKLDGFWPYYVEWPLNAEWRQPFIPLPAPPAWSEV